MASLHKNESSANCSLGGITNQIGLHQFQGMLFHRALRLFVPDFVVCIFAALLLAFIRRIEGTNYHALATSTTSPSDLNEASHNSFNSFSSRVGHLAQFNLQRELIVSSIFNIATIACFVLAAIMSASVLSAVYLLVCLGFATLWACMKLSKSLRPIRILLLIYAALHILLYYLYQFPFAQRILPANTLSARLLGLYWLFQSSCSLPGEIVFNEKVRWTEYVTPPITMLLFYVLARGTRRSLAPRSSLEEQRGAPANVADSLAPIHVDDADSLASSRCDARDYERQRLISDGAVEAPNYASIRRSSTEAPEGASVPLQSRDTMERPSHTEKPFFLSLLSKIIRVSYIVTFLSMMAWSIIYVSWLSFVMLLTACLIWVVPKSRLVCLHLSPFIVFYGSVMLCLQYVYAMNLPELPTEVNNISLSYFGMKKFKQPAGVLAVQFGLMLGFWLTLRLYTTEKQMAARRSRQVELSQVQRGSTLLTLDSLVFGIEENRKFRRLMHLLQQQLVKVWIIVTCLLMFFISTQQPVVLFRVVYMILFLYFMFTFLVSYDFWRRQMIVFWWVVIVYSMIVLILIYTFQFKEVRSVWNDFLQNATLVDMGLQEFKSSGLFLRLTTPVIFLVVVIFQVHYFHSDFLKISAINPDIEPQTQQRTTSEDRISQADTSANSEDFVTDVTSVFHIIWAKMVDFWAKRYLIWRFMEVHGDKIVLITAAVCATRTVSLLWVPMLLIFVLFLPVLRSRVVSLALLYLWIGGIIIVKMSFQLPSFLQLSFLHNATDCRLSNLTDGKVDGIISWSNDTNWAGLKDSSGYRGDISYPMALLVIIIINMVVHYHQRQWYIRRNQTPPPPGIIFENVSPQDVQKNLTDLIKFLFNHGFFKLGLEITFIVNVIGIVIRTDVYALIYLFFTVCLIFLPRPVLARVWSTYVFVLSFLLLFQYIFVLGLPLSLCQAYPWTKYFYDLNHPQWIDFLYLPDYVYRPNVSFLLADFFRFLFALLQLNVFRLEAAEGVEERGGGDNKPVLEDVMPPRGTRDFISVKESFIDYMMHGILMYFYYVCLVIIFITGLAINLLSLLYLIASFIFLWIGMNLFTYKRNQVLRIWNCLIGFNLVVLFLKCGLQIAGCIYLAYLKANANIIPDLFSVTCLNPYAHAVPKSPSLSTPVESSDSRRNAHENIFGDTLTWDVICFACMLLQRKIFSTRIFANIVLDVRVQKKFASRGAAIINSRLIYEVTKQKLEESRNLARVRRKLERIRLRRQTWGVPTYTEHYKVLRSGDARLFEGDSDNEDDSTVMAGTDDQERKDPDTDGGMVTSALESHSDDNLEDGTAPAISSGPRLRKKVGYAVRLPPEDEEPHPMRALNLITRAIDTSPSTALEELGGSGGLPGRPRRKSTRSQSETGLAGHLGATAPSPPASQSLREVKSEGKEGKEGSEDEKTETLHFSSSEEWDVVQQANQSRILPSTPEGQPEDDLFEDAAEEMEDEEARRGCWTNFKASCIIAWRVFASVIDSLVATLNRITKEFRTIRLTLEAERKLAKRKVKERGELSALDVEDLSGDADTSSSDDHRLSEQKQWKRDVKALAQQVAMAEKEFKKNQSRFFLLLIALGNFASQYWEQLCYFVMVVNHLTSATLLSMVYPFLIFMWGMLSVPRPSKLFWTVTITYTMIVIIIKYFFQFPTVRDIVHLNGPIEHPLDEGPMTLENLFGLNRASDFATLDLVQLMVIFIHRGFLKANGLWRAVSETRDDLLQLAKKYGASLGYEEEQTDDVTVGTSSQPRPISAATLSSEMVEHYEHPAEHSYQSPLMNIKRFFQKMTDPLFNMRVDVYRWIFFVEFLGLIVLVLTYKSFVPYTASTDSVAAYITQSRVPMPFIAMCFMQFILIIIDRALFLQKLVFGKLIFQFVLMIGIHVWMFLVLPFITNKRFTDNWAAQIFYFLKCIYFGLSAYQIRSGYPIRVLGNFLTKKYNYVNLFLYKGFTVVPFLMDLRCVMDWIWTETTLGLYHWNQMEHIYSIVYVVKCWHYSEDQWPTPRGQRRGKAAKYGLGGLVVGIIVAAIWLPMFLFYILTATATPSIPQHCELTLSIGGFTPIFTVGIQSNRISTITDEQHSCIKNKSIDLKNDPMYALIEQYQPIDIAPLEFDSNSTVIWSITPPGLNSLHRQLELSATPMSTELTMTCKRKGDEGTVSTIFTHALNESTRRKLAQLVISNETDLSPVLLTRVYPRFVKVSGVSIDSVTQTFPQMNWINVTAYKNQIGDIKWWRIREEDPKDPFSFAIGTCFGKYFHGKPTIITLNERAVQKNFLTMYLTSTGLIGVYIVLVMWMAEFLRRMLYASDTLRFDDMPQVDRLLRLLDDIYLVREHKDWQLEEELYSKLDYLWRSPETLIQYSKPKQE